MLEAARIALHGIASARPCLLASDAGFAALLGRDARPCAQPLGLAVPGTIRIFVETAQALHLLAWRLQSLHRAPLAVVVPVAGAHLDAAWHHAVLPPPDVAAPSRSLTGLAAFDGEGLKARFEFAWIKTVGGDWTLDDSKTPRLSKNATALEPVAGASTAAWPTSCGRCQRYPLAAKAAAPQLALCRRDCLERASPF